jgi:rhamnogalacturonyl hydrolase YesR
MDKNKIKNIINSIDNWISQNGWEGFDPYDIKGMPSVLKITKWGNKSFFAEIIREAIFELFLRYPEKSRKIFKVEPQINPKAMGLFASTYLDLFILNNEEKYHQKFSDCIIWLDNNSSKEYLGKGWGYPFDWQTKVLIPKNTPNGIVTTAVGDAYWKLYKHSNDKKYLNTCVDICNFLTKSLPHDEIAKDKICFSYTPIYINHVHNLNLFVAEFLIKVGQEINNKDWINQGTKAANYTISNQAEDGSFDYNGPPDHLRHFKDNYHTAFVLRMLYSIYKLTNDEKTLASLTKCYNHYINNFFEVNSIPKFTPYRKYRIDIHSCAESINCLAELSPMFPEGLEIAQNVAEWTINNLYDESGYFYHGVFKSRILKKTFISKIAYIRWNQAWMLKGLANLYKVLK